MSKMLSLLVGVPEQLFALRIKQLEQSSGYPGIDVQLSADIIGKIHLHIKALGLDPHDTTGEELYYALLDVASLHDEFLVKHMGGDNRGNVSDLLPRIHSFVDSIDMPKNVWAVKHSSIKKMLKSMPPKKVMKQLGYRSIDSMLKREKTDELMVGVRILESTTWQQKFISKYSKLTPQDFENRDFKFLMLDGEKWGTQVSSFVKENHQNLTNLKEMGVVAILPLPITYLEGITLTLCVRLLHYFNQVRAYSNYFKLHQVKPDFGYVLAETIQNDPSRHATMAGQHIHWKTVNQFLGQESSREHSALFEPHINPDDLFWRKAEEILYRVEPALHFWHDMDYVGVYIDDKPLSFNLLDVSANLVNKIEYPNHLNSHLKNALNNELNIRYFGSRTLRNDVIRQLVVEEAI